MTPTQIWPINVAVKPNPRGTIKVAPKLLLDRFAHCGCGTRQPSFQLRSNVQSGSISLDPVSL